MGISCYSKKPIMNYQIETKFVFTRYLYEKDEVKMALLIAILNKTDDAIFWAYELYYSGFTDELIELLWKIYYDFYAAYCSRRCAITVWFCHQRRTRNV